MDSRRRETDKPFAENDNDYLWDGSGRPDPEVQQLESLLGKFRHDRPAPAFPAIVPAVVPAVVPTNRWKFLSQRSWIFPVLAAAAAVVLITAIVLIPRGTQQTPEVAEGWHVSGIAGTPRIGSSPINGASSRRIAIGQALETDHQSRAELDAENVGRIEVDADTRLRLLSVGASKQIALDHGTIHAYIWSPPGQFVVETPSAVTVDLGCAYTLHVDDSGAGTVRTSVGWVGFKLNGREAFIPAGAACSTKPKLGPGTPYFEDASANFRAALERFDFTDGTPSDRARDLAVLLSEARPRDALTLWHLLTRVDEGQRALVYERLKKLAPPPPGVSRDGILRLDQPMLDQWWNALGFDDISVWRHWEHSWTGTTEPAGTY
jgi:hypothetical protein